MRIPTSFALASSLFALAFAPARSASAFGGYFPDPAHEGQSQIAAHRALIALSPDKTVLWDQMSFTGAPESFVWVLPIKGQVEVGLSSDAFFGWVETMDRMFFNLPDLECPLDADSFYYAPAPYHQAPIPAPHASPSRIAEEVVGPYEIKQLSSQADPNALKTFLTGSGYTLTADVSALIDTYVAEGFDFLALKLLPGLGLDAMRPVRVTTQGATPVLPLRMMAAGAGATVPLRLWVVGEGLYEPSGSSLFSISRDQLTWDWEKGESNYKSLVADGFAKTSQRGWQLEAYQPFQGDFFLATLNELALLFPRSSGYADDMGNGALEAYKADESALWELPLSPQAMVTRLYAELPREALTADLTLLPAGQTSDVALPALPIFLSSFQVKNGSLCPATPPWKTSGQDAGSSSSPPSMEAGDGDGDGGGCACTTAGLTNAAPAPFGALLALGWVLARRRKARGSAAP